MQFQFKTKIPDVNQRKKMSENIIQSYPDKIPMICEKDPDAKFRGIDKTKFIIDKDIMIYQLIENLSRKTELGEKESLFLLVDGKYALTGTTTLGDIYKKFANKEDGFLYIVYTSKEIWGAKLR